MSEKKALTTNGLVLPNFGFMIINLGMIMVSAYLTQHYMQTHFPEGLKGAMSFCNVSQFWNCDVATLSPLGNIAGIPTSLFGLLVGVMGLAAAILGKESLEQTVKTIFAVNLIGCLILFLYSLIALNGLCPMCTVYYVLSFAASFMLHKFSSVSYGIDPKVFGSIAALCLIPIIGMSFHIGGKEKKKSALAGLYIKQFNDLKDYGDPVTESPYKLHQATEKFSEGKIRISIFSDFQCPYCQKAAEQGESIIEDFKDSVNIQYFFYPLDSSCNTQMKGGSPHPFACMAAYLAACDKEKFPEIHDYIFANQSAINFDSLKEWQKKFGLEGCLDKKELQDVVQQTLNAGEQFNIRSTPTIIVNGKKLEGLIPYQHLKGILESLIK